MVMSWIKKLLELFNLEDSKSEHNQPRSEIERHINANKHIETRVTYQYPKGDFKFPIIPDKVAMDKREPNTRIKEQRKVDSKPRYKEQRKVEPKSTRIKDQIEPSKKVRPETKKVSDNMPKKPFQPTEIPSPVHGFRPKKNIDVVEYELLSKQVNQEVAASVEIEQALQPEKSSSLQEYESQSTRKDTHICTENEVEVPTLNKKNNGDLENILDLFDELKEEEQVMEPIHEINEEEQVVEPTHVIKEEEEVVEPPQELKEENQKIEELANESKGTNGASIPSYSEEVKMIESDNKEEDSDTLSEEAVHPDSKEKEERPKRKRSEIPFNVIMLKQDRQRVKDNSRSKTVENKNEDIKIEKENIEKIEEEVQVKHEESTVESSSLESYQFPHLTYLNKQKVQPNEDVEWVENQRFLLDEALKSFKVRAKVVNVTQGPAVTRFEVHPEPGVKVNKITNLADDIKLNLSAKEIRIEAPIPGKNTIGIEVPNKESKSVLLSEILSSQEFSGNESPLTVALGLDISGKPIITDLKKMPHGLIAGATGSGKSVCINTMLISLLYNAAPHEVKLLLIDPKMVELAPYNHIPHLVSPVITDVKAATASLKWAVEEMERRYELFAHSGVRDISRYNEMVNRHNEKSGELPYIVIIIDELADLMMVAPGDVEEAICRIAQKARACGIHLIVATQRPSVDVITGLIKANIPTRIAFSVSSQVDSRTIIDSSGAEKLLGKGDMLFLENGSSKPVRIQGNFVSDDEIEQVVAHVKNEMKPSYFFEQEELIKKASVNSDDDELYSEACEFVYEQGGASTSSLQRNFRIGYNRAARLIDLMEEQGIISEARGSKPREVLITGEELNNIQENSN